jgi:hypothetical protein
VVTAFSYASLGNEHYVLDPSPDPEGSIVARTTEDVLDGIATWPGNVFELRVEPRDILEQGSHVLRVRRYDVVGAVPRERVFGRHVAALDAFIADLPGFGWLRPSSQGRGPQTAVLVAEHYAALGHYGRVRVGGSRIVHDLEAVEPLITAPCPVAARDELTARRQAHRAATRAVERKVRPRMKEVVARSVASIVVPGAWRAAWKHVAAAHLEYGLAALCASYDVLDVVSTELIEWVAHAVDVAMETGLEELGTMNARDGQTAELGRPPVERTVAVAREAVPQSPVREGVTAIVTHLVRHVWFFSWRFTTHAAKQTAWHAYHRISGLHQPDPWAPWVGMLRLGLWPALDDGVDMTLYEPKANAE